MSRVAFGCLLREYLLKVQRTFGKVGNGLIGKLQHHQKTDALSFDPLKTNPAPVILENGCPLCHQAARPFYLDVFFECVNCAGIFRTREYLPTSEDEKSRYEEHHNDVLDPRYRQFVSPITSSVIRDYGPESVGLDFGSGTGPVISQVLLEAGYDIKQYDPFFDNKPEVLECQYDYIACCEVMEHFHNPKKEFHLLQSLLKPGGHLYCMTHLYTPAINFDNWYYRRDKTHSFIYQAATLKWIQEKWYFSTLTVDERLIVFKKS